MMLFADGIGMISAFTQSTFEKSQWLSKDEVPVTVMQSFQKGFSSLEGNEYWKLHYTEKNRDGKTVFIRVLLIHKQEQLGVRWVAILHSRRPGKLQRSYTGLNYLTASIRKGPS